MWLDAADSSAVTIATGVSGWRDKSGNAYNLTQSTTGSQPSYASNLITFSNNTYLNIPQAAMNNLSTWSLFFVINPISSSNWIMAKQKDGANTYNVLSMTYNTTNGGNPQTGSTGFLYWRSLNNAGQLVSTAAITTSTLQIWNLTYDGTSIYFYKNGVLEKTTAGSFAISNDTNATNFTLGVWIQASTIINSGVTNFRLGEMILYSSFPNTTERQQLEGYLAWKWGLAPPTTKGFIPTSISGCELWFDGGDYTTMFQNVEGTSNVSNSNQSVARWTDKIRSLSISNTGVPGQSMQAPTSISGGGLFFSNTSTVVGSSAQGLGRSLTGATNQSAYLFRMPTRHMTLITASYPLSNNSLRQICCIASSPNGAGNVPNFNMGHEIGAGNGGTILFDWDGANWGQIAQSTSGYNSNAVLRIDSLIATTTPLWSTNGSSNTFTQTNDYTSALTNYPVNNFAIGGYSSTFVGSRNFHGNVYEILLYSKALTTDERKKVESYLSKKWSITLSNVISFSNPFYSIQPFSRRFNPIDIPGCAVWFDAADRSKITGSSTVTAWRDKSSNSWNATTLIGTSPTNTTVNGNNAISFPASSTLTVSNVTLSSVQSRAIFVVYRVVTSGNYISWFSTQASGINNQGGHNNLILPTGGGGPYVQSYAVGGAVQGMGADPAVSTIGTTAIACMIHSAVSTASNAVTLNGTSYTLTTNTLASGYGSGTINYYIGNAYPQAYILCEYILYQSEFTVAQRQQVEGYLANKWGVVSSLPATHLYKKLTPSSTVSFLPTGISGCSLWLDPADTSTVILNESSVVQLRDKSGLGYNMSQATSGNRPTYSTSLNGNRMLTFTQSLSTRLSNTSFPTFIGSGPASYFLVEYNMTAPSGNPGPFGYSAGPNGGLIMQSNAGYTGGLQPFQSGITSFTSATPRLIFLYKPNVTSSNMTGFINGTSQTVSDTTSGTYSGTFSVGSALNGFISGNICELIVFNKSLTTSERQQVEGYLADKWGVKSSLPSTHLYRNFAPSFVGVTAPDSGYSNFLWTRFYNLTGDPSINGPGSSGWGSLIGTAGAYSPINYQDSDSRIGQSDFVGVVSKGFMYSATQTVVTFRTLSDDGIVVIFNGSNVIQNWTYHGDTTDTSASVTLPAGYTPIELRFFEWGGGFTCELSWSVGSTGSYVSDGTSRMYHTNASKT
jgi:hypothetical protein